jgi:biopolymer transport protein ExbD
MNFLPRRRKKPEIMIVSLIDIFAILLIFVIVNTTFRREQPGVTIKLPESKTAVSVSSGSEALKLSIDDKGGVYLGAKKVTLPELRVELDALMKLPSPPKLALAPDEASTMGVYIKVVDILKEAGVKGDITSFTEKAP